MNNLETWIAEVPDSLPNDTPCDLSGHGHLLNDCPNWVSVPENLADAKALLAFGGLSIIRQEMP